MKKSEKELNYDAAMEELQEIVTALQNDAIGIDILTEKVKRAAELIRFCKEKLRQVEDDMEEVLHF